jgi:DnaJ family protein A protein 5
MTNEHDERSSSNIRCHYEVLGVSSDADLSEIKKRYRKLALIHHPDKNPDNGAASQEEFLSIQAAYECLSDTIERKWYDEHRDAILRGWTTTSADENDQEYAASRHVFDITPYMYAGCFHGFDDRQERNFYAVYSQVFAQIYQNEWSQGGTTTATTNDSNPSCEYLNVPFGDSQTPWEEVNLFYQAWESYSSTMNFAWADLWNLTQAENRQTRRKMEEENKKARKTAKRTRNDDIVALVHFVKKRDPRVKRQKEWLEQQRYHREHELQQQTRLRKQQKKQAMDEWRTTTEQEKAALEEEDRLAGRIRLADLEEDYDYGGGKKSKGKKKKKKKKNREQAPSGADDDDNDDEDLEVAQEEEDEPFGACGNCQEDQNGSKLVSGLETQEFQYTTSSMQEPTQDDILLSDDEVSSDEEEEDPDEWRCECCKKDFKSRGQMENHLQSKKHKAAWKKYEAKMSQIRS